MFGRLTRVVSTWPWIFVPIGTWGEAGKIKQTYSIRDEDGKERIVKSEKPIKKPLPLPIGMRMSCSCKMEIHFGQNWTELNRTLHQPMTSRLIDSDEWMRRINWIQLIWYELCEVAYGFPKFLCDKWRTYVRSEWNKVPNAPRRLSVCVAVNWSVLNFSFNQQFNFTLSNRRREKYIKWNARRTRACTSNLKQWQTG